MDRLLSDAAEDILFGEGANDKQVQNFSELWHCCKRGNRVNYTESNRQAPKKSTNKENGELNLTRR